MNTMKYYGAAKYNRTGAGKYSRLSGQSTLTPEELRAMLEKNIAAKEAFKKAAERKATKSKVCIIANRLIKQGVNRSEAFRRAWTIVKAAKIETKVSGVTFGSRQKALERLTHYETDKISIRLEREAANEYDSNAIQVIATVTDKFVFDKLEQYRHLRPKQIFQAYDSDSKADEPDVQYHGDRYKTKSVMIFQYYTLYTEMFLIQEKI